MDNTTTGPWRTGKHGAVYRTVGGCGHTEYRVFAYAPSDAEQPHVEPTTLFQFTGENIPVAARGITIRFREPVGTSRDTGLGRLDRVTPLGLLLADTDGQGWERTFVPWANVACISWDMSS